MTYSLLLTLLLSIAAPTNGLPVDLRTSTADILTTRGEAKSDGKGLSDEAIISIAVPIGLSIIGVATRIKRNHAARERKAKPKRKVHRRWYQSRC